MKLICKKIILLACIISTANMLTISASWYNPSDVISIVSQKIRSFFHTIGIKRLFTLFRLSSSETLQPIAPAITTGPALTTQPLSEIGSATVIQKIESAEQFTNLINTYLAAINDEFTQPEKWFSNSGLNAQLPGKFIPFVQKADIPAGSIVNFHGDFHGNYPALQQYIRALAAQNYINADSLEITNKNCYLVFLGDYADRGPNGVDVYSMLMQLKMKNHNNVFLLRGNHEDMALQKNYGFLGELKVRFGENKVQPLLNSLDKVYNSLPVALYLRVGNQQNNEYILCCHGLWEFGYDPAPFLKDSSSAYYQAFNMLKRKTLFDQLAASFHQEADKSEHQGIIEKLWNNLRKSGLQIQQDVNITTPYTQSYALGFLWDDSKVHPRATSEFNRQRGMEWSWQDINFLCKLLEKENIFIKAIYRAHQHGVPELWTQQAINQGYAQTGMVYTFLNAPNRGYPNRFDIWGELQVKNTYESSTLKFKGNKDNVGAPAAN